MRIAIIVDQAHVRLWHERLCSRLSRLLPDHAIELRGTAGAAAYPAAVDALLMLERMLLRRSQQTLCDRVAQPLPPHTDSPDADVIIDLTGAIEPLVTEQAQVLRPLYDGSPSETDAIATILGGVAPAITLEDTATGARVGEALPSFEAADGLTGGLEAVFSRLITLIEQRLLSPQSPSVPGPAAAPMAVPQQPRLGSKPAAFFLRNITRECVRQIYHLCCHSPHWRIGWRFNDGPGVLERGSLAGPRWNILPHEGSAFAADPFPIEWNGESYIFYERLDYATGKGAIFAQRLDATGVAAAPVLVLEEAWHLSYPFLIAHQGELYMLPEASLSGAVTLYRCIEFPHKWRAERQLLNGIEAADATIFEHGGRFWMTSVVRDGVGGYSDTLAIHHAPDLLGPWEEHTQRPVLIDSRYARPAGNVTMMDGALWRPVQDCSTGYGKKLALMRIDALDTETFAQTRMSLIAPGPRWPGSRLHTLNRWGRLECIDGAIFTPKSETLARRLHARIDQRAFAEQAFCA